MKRSTLTTAALGAGLSAVAAYGCSVYSDAASQSQADAALPEAIRPSPRTVAEQAPPRQPPQPPAAKHAPSSADEAAPEPDRMDAAVNPGMDTETDMEALPVRTPPPNHNDSVRLARSERFDGYLTDGFGRALYMLTDDIAGSTDSACKDDCARVWPPFHTLELTVSPELDPADFSAIHRQDGPWQTTYKVHPLYYRAMEGSALEVTGDGLEQRWFVARDYLLFLTTTRAFTPLGGMTAGASYLTDGFGRTLYVCLDDQPRTETSDAVSSCSAACTVKRPIFSVAETGRTTLLPSVIDPLELHELARPDGQRQLTYRGWPLYYFSGDLDAGATAGHNDRTWRAIDPVSFGLTG